MENRGQGLSASGYTLRRTRPFQGVVRILEQGAARAATLNGRVWLVEVAVGQADRGWGMAEPPGSGGGLLPYGYWAVGEGMIRHLPLDPRLGIDPEGVREAGEAMAAALGRMGPATPFPVADRFELWLLDAQDAQPLALIGTAREPPGPGGTCSEHWRPYDLRDDPPPLPEGAAEIIARVEALVDRAGGQDPALQWFRRGADGSGEGLGGAHLRPREVGRRLAAGAFPPTLLREAWPEAAATTACAGFRELLAPRLLTLPGLGEGRRAELEGLAWRRPVLVHHLHRLYPRVIDQAGLTTALVAARLILGEGA